MWIKYFTITLIVEGLVCTGEGENAYPLLWKQKENYDIDHPDKSSLYMRKRHL